MKPLYEGIDVLQNMINDCFEDFKTINDEFDTIFGRKERLWTYEEEYMFTFNQKQEIHMDLDQYFKTMSGSDVLDTKTYEYEVFDTQDIKHDTLIVKRELFTKAHYSHYK